MRLVVPILLLALASCNESASEDVDASPYQMSCVSEDHCPGPYECIPELAKCLVPCETAGECPEGRDIIAECSTVFADGEPVGTFCFE